MLTKQELELRRSGIAGTDIAAILGKSPYKSALGVYLDKKGLSTPFSITAAQEFGLEQEAYILRKYSEMEKCSLRSNPGFKRHPDLPYLVSNIDAIRSDNIVVDAKNIGLYGDKGEYNTKGWGKQRTSQMPRHYYLQIAHYCLVWQSHEGHMAPYFGGFDLRVYVYQKRHAIERLIQEEAKRFWYDHVLADKPPVDKGTYKEVSSLWHAVKNEEKITATPNVEDLIKELRDIKAAKDELAAKEDEKRSKVAAFMEDKAVLSAEAGSVLATWKKEERSRFDLDSFRKEKPEIHDQYIRTTSCRTFRIK